MTKISEPITGTSLVVPGLHFARPADDARHANAAFVHGALATAQSAGRAAAGRLDAVSLGTVVGGEDDERVVGQLQLVERAHQLAEGVVELRDVGVMLDLHVVGQLRILRLEFRCGLDRVVRLVRPHARGGTASTCRDAPSAR